MGNKCVLAQGISQQICVAGLAEKKKEAARRNASCYEPWMLSQWRLLIWGQSSNPGLDAKEFDEELLGKILWPVLCRRSD